MGRLCNVNIQINGIYGDGGYLDSRARFWFHEFWKTSLAECGTFSPKITTGVANDKDIYLGGLYGQLFVHPAQISGILETSNSAETEVFESQLRDLDTIMNRFSSYMEEACSNRKVTYRINSAVIPMPRELYAWREFKPETRVCGGER